MTKTQPGLWTVLAFVGVGVAGAPASADAPATQPAATKVSTGVTLELERVTLKDAVARWSVVSGRQVVCNWKALELAGIDPQTLVSVSLRDVPAVPLLRTIAEHASAGQGGADNPDARLMVEANAYYVRVLTRAEANRRVVTRVYLVGDLLHEVPDFQGPSLTLTDALSNTNNGNAGHGEQGLFDDEPVAPTTAGDRRALRENNLMDTLRSVVEPDLWKANGGTVASMSIRRNLLIVRAPDYAHRQIGLPVRPSLRRSTGAQDRGSSRASLQQGITAEPIAAIRER